MLGSMRTALGAKYVASGGGGGYRYFRFDVLSNWGDTSYCDWSGLDILDSSNASVLPSPMLLAYTSTNATEVSGFPVTNLFDGVLGGTGRWLMDLVAGVDLPDIVLYIDCQASVTPATFRLASSGFGAGGRMIKDVDIYGSNDNSNWTAIMSVQVYFGTKSVWQDFTV